MTLKLNRIVTYYNDIICTGGTTASGKALTSRVLECYNGVGKVVEIEFMYLINELNRLGKLSDDDAITVIKTIYDRETYFQKIGRNINFKTKDVSSIFKYPYPLDYLKYMFSDDSKRNKIVHELYEENPAVNNIMHEALTHSRLHFKALKNRLKMIYVIRNPIDILYITNNRGYIDRIGSNPTAVTYTYTKGKYIIPAFAKSWENEYIKSSSVDKLIKWVHQSMHREYESYKKLSQDNKSNVMMIDFDSFVQHPHTRCKAIQYFIDRDPTWKLKRILKKENCPRKIDKKEREFQEKYLRAISRKEKLIDELLELYWKWGYECS